MLKKAILFFSLSVLALPYARAQTCPTIADLRQGQFNQWQPLDLDNGEPIIGKRLKQYQHKVTSFAFAMWVPSAPEGAGECFYNGGSQDDDYLNIYLAKATGEPDKNTGNWHSIGLDLLQCNASITNCRFLN
jgi:hypothetical protein